MKKFVKFEFSIYVVEDAVVVCVERDASMDCAVIVDLRDR